MTTMNGSSSNGAQAGGGFRLPGWKFWQRAQTPAPKANGTAQKASVKGSVALVTTTDGDQTTQIQFQIKHWVRGRLRLSIPRLVYDTEYGDRLQYLIVGTSSAFSVRVNTKAQTLVIRYDPENVDPAEFLQEIVICVKNASKPEAALAKYKEEPEEVEQINYLKRLGLPGVGLALVLGTFAGLAVPPALLAGVITVSAIPAFRRAYEGIRYEKKLNVDFLDSTAIVALTATGFYFPPALMIGLIESGEIIRDLTARRTARANLDLLDSLGKTARVERGGIEIELPLAEVIEGDIVVVYPGDQIPVDGTVASGLALIDQQKLTGESIPVTRESGQDVFAATLVVDGSLRIETRRTGDQTRAGIVVSLMKSAPVHDTRMEDYAKKVGDRIVIPTLALGTAVTFATGGNIVRGVGVITLDIGTGVRVSVPTAILASLTYAARNGVLIRSGRAIEQLANVDTIVFDKTGTLTQGNAGVVGIYISERAVDSWEVLQLAATAEQGLTHPVAEAIVRHARENEIFVGECDEWEYHVGQGIEAQINGRNIYVGSGRMMRNMDIPIEAFLSANPEIEASAASQVYVAEDDALLGIILYKDPARPESVEVINDLHRMNITPYMLSGDMQRVADAIAAELGIAPEHVYAEAFPERKVEVVKELQESGKTIAFVGDGINDSAALAHASVSISFAGATDMARETADIVLMDDDLSALILAIQISKHALRVVRQNVGIVVVPNATGMVIAALIGLDPVLAVLLNNGSAIAAEMNGFRPLLGPPGRKQSLPAPESYFAAALQETTLENLAEAAIDNEVIELEATVNNGHVTIVEHNEQGNGHTIALELDTDSGQECEISCDDTGSNGLEARSFEVHAASVGHEPIQNGHAPL
ncbi:MAG: heavy metal translocating P-type ATPase [Anaerolineae bacterium]|nr:heavy metal translocating P-type ATPase [Anaerolineae bacterium]MCO5190144.1 heavy metal translocating P-type ATPase [Anaerolineae bacterium]MCO5192879.1 heavy metal translocating P-type ATPase [Anaerolineae bacterium]MCO5198284.1 heavy metal translocating P-type ATPase [Anaerolineae bacterium]